MKSVVVDGATSMLGLALINECIEKKIKVLAIARKGSKRLERLPKSGYVEIVLCDQEEMADLDVESMEKYEVYYHFAWGNVLAQERRNVTLQEPNIGYTFDAVHLAKRLGCKRFVGAGSQAEYGRVSGLIGPDTPVNPEVAYGVAKYAAGKMAMILCDSLAIECIWTRTFSVYGIGDNDTTLIMYTIDKLFKGERPIFTKAEQKWDYLYSKDAGEAFLLIGEKGKKGKTYCIGSGESRPLWEYIYAVRDEVDPRLTLGIGEMEYAPLQVMNLQADISDLKKDTGFEPRYSFEEGIRETIEWYKSRKRAGQREAEDGEQGDK